MIEKAPTSIHSKLIKYYGAKDCSGYDELTFVGRIPTSNDFHCSSTRSRLALKGGVGADRDYILIVTVPVAESPMISGEPLITIYEAM
jgi:hypothetical protein